jgi:hypothetical protein
MHNHLLCTALDCAQSIAVSGHSLCTVIRSEQQFAAHSLSLLLLPPPP